MAKTLPFSFNDFQEELLRVLSKTKEVNTLSRNKKNRIIVKDGVIKVQTDRSFPEYEDIPQEFIKITYEALKKDSYVKQSDLSKKLYVKRSAFIMAAFTLLEYIEYDKDENSIKLKIK